MPQLNYETTEASSHASTKLRHNQALLPVLAYRDDVRQLWLYLKPLPYLRLHMSTKPTEAVLEGVCRVTRRRVLFGLGRDPLHLLP